MPLHEDYTVRIDAFQGPLDLLLYLIRRAEVDVHNIPIHEITDQYFGFLKQIDHVDIDLAGEFLVMAATLIEIKSRTLAPPKARAEADGDGGAPAPRDDVDPRHELVQQLLAYQRYRNAAEELNHRRDEFRLRYAATVRPELDRAPVDAEDAGVELEDAHLLDLFDAYERIVGSIDFARLGEHRVEYDDTPIALHQEDLLDQLRRAPMRRASFRRIFEGRTRLEAIGLFLAMLELARQRMILVEQNEDGGEIEIAVVEDPVEESVSDDASRGSA
ncbi:MAG: segregation/condensation protein A [Phycisphaerales bacterium]|nr:segregation/condensation protein A [Phycisphaerales bacterium]